MAKQTIEINRAPVMTLWAVVVAERLGYSHDEALTLGRAVTGLNAYSKAKAIGLIPKTEKEPSDKKTKPTKAADTIELLSRRVPVTKTKDGLRALAKKAPVVPASVERYLNAKFKDALPAVLAAMKTLASSRAPKALALEAYALYEKFRPDIPAGEAGWGKAGSLNIDAIRALSSAR